MILQRTENYNLLGAFLIRRYKIVFPSNIWGKLYSFSMAVLIVAYTLRLSWGLWLGWEVLGLLELVVLALLGISSLSYSLNTTRYIRSHHRHQRMNKKIQAARDGEAQASLQDRDKTESQV